MLFKQYKDLSKHEVQNKSSLLSARQWVPPKTMMCCTVMSFSSFAFEIFPALQAGNISSPQYSEAINFFPLIPIPRGAAFCSFWTVSDTCLHSSSPQDAKRFNSSSNYISQQFNEIFNRSVKIKKLQLKNKIVKALQSAHAYVNMY